MNNFEVQSNVNRAAKIFEEYGDFIRSVIRYNVKNWTLTEDLFQDFFLYLVAKPIPEDVIHMKAFLYRLVSDKTKDALRRRVRYRARVQKYASEYCKSVEYWHRWHLNDSEEAEKMLNMIEKRLPSKQAQAIKFRFKSTQHLPEIAIKMRIKPRSVSRYVSTGLRKIRNIFPGT